jgi:hypothetical protein
MFLDGMGEGYLSVGRRCDFMHCLTSAGAISWIAHKRANTGERFSSREESEIESVF